MPTGLPGAVLVARRSRMLARQLLAVALCALAAHTAVYGSLVPTSGAHAYFAWYAPLVTALSAVSMIALPLALVIGLVAGRGRAPTRVLASLLPTRSAEGGAVADAFKLASLALVFLTTQESLERSLSSGRFVLASFPLATLLLVVAAILVAATVVVLVEHVASTLADAIRRAERPFARRAARTRWHLRSAALGRRGTPLAVHGALRAPPVAL